jgi:hypothetical protein
MFNYCESLSQFDCDLSSLENGEHMFSDCYSLESFKGDLSSLTDGEKMFNNCPSLKSFEGDLSSLTNGYGMFNYCPNLKIFKGNLSSLENGEYMFTNCKLNADSIHNIAITLPHKKTSSQRLDLGIDNDTLTLFEQVKRDLGLIKAKGWNLYVNGSSTFNSIFPVLAYLQVAATADKATYWSYINNQDKWVEHLPLLKDSGT